MQSLIEKQTWLRQREKQMRKVGIYIGILSLLAMISGALVSMESVVPIVGLCLSAYCFTVGWLVGLIEAQKNNA